MTRIPPTRIPMKKTTRTEIKTVMARDFCPMTQYPPPGMSQAHSAVLAGEATWRDACIDMDKELAPPRRGHNRRRLDLDNAVIVQIECGDFSVVLAEGQSI